MDLSNLYSSLSLIQPEIAISVTLALIVIFDLIFDKDKKFIPFIVIGGLVVTGYLIFNQYDLIGYAFPYSQSPTAREGLLVVDSLGIFFKIIIVISSLIIVFFSYTSDEILKTSDRLGEYYTLMFGMILGMMFMVSASDLILIYLSLELLSLSSYVLAGFTKLRERNSEVLLKYLIYGGVSSGIMLFGISILYGLTGTTNLYAIGTFLQTHNLNLLTLAFASIMIFAGIGYKISSAPFHFWTPDVYEGAPISITAFLSVASKAAGFGLLIRFVRTAFVSFSDPVGNWTINDVFDWQALLVIIAVLTMTLGNFSALWQNNVKRMLAYSSIAHAGFMMLGLAVLTDQGLLGILVYFVMYLFMNLGAFFVVMLISNKTGSEEIEDYNGLGYTAPFLGVAFVIFMISLVGLPPTAGFIGKLYIFIALIDAEMFTVAVIAILNTVVSLYYYIRVLKHMFLTKRDENTPSIPVSKPNLIFTLVLLIPTLLFGIYFTPVLNFAKNSLALLGL